MKELQLSLTVTSFVSVMKQFKKKFMPLCYGLKVLKQKLRLENKMA